MLGATVPKLPKGSCLAQEAPGRSPEQRHDGVLWAYRDACRKEVTVMEMLCASPCLTTMIFFSLGQKLRGDRALDQDTWMNRQRMAARGNATAFPSAWEDLLQQLQALTGERSPLHGCEKADKPGGLQKRVPANGMVNG